MSGKPFISKNQKVGRIKHSDIKVQNHIIMGEENYEQVSNFRDGIV